jgi:uncharacterized protein with gpF-like domain
VTKQQYIRQQQIIQNRMMKHFYPLVQAALQHQVKTAIAVIKKKGITAAQGNINGDILNVEMGKVIGQLYRSAASIAFRKYKPTMKSFGDNTSIVDKVIAYLKNYLLQKVVVPISQTTVNQIEAVLQKAQREGWGVDETVKELEDEDLTKFRARLIVRTETVKATNITQLAAADNEDFEMEKQWIAIEDARTRRSHSHAGVDGERRNLDEAYSNGLMFPGDPNGGPEEVCNCRCTQGYFAKRAIDGKLIPKKERGFTILHKLQLAA